MNSQLKLLSLLSRWDARLEKVLKDYRDYSQVNERQKSYSEFLEVPLREILILQEDFAVYKYPAVEQATKAILKDWKVMNVRRFYENEKEAVPLYFQMEVGDGVYESLLEDGIRYYRSLIDGRKLIMRFGVQANSEGVKYSVRIFFIMKRTQETLLRGLIQEIKSWIRAHHYLKGKKVKPDGSLLKMGRKYTFNDIVLSQEIMTEIEENVLDFFQSRETYIQTGIPRKRGLILYGDPGTGKTLLGKVLCSQIDCTFIWVSPSNLTLPIEVSHLFEMARELSPTIIYMEDLDFYASNRNAYSGANICILGEILNQMDGFEENGDVVVIATTNDIKSIEPALKDRPSRFDRVLELKPPDLLDRKELLRRLLPSGDGVNEITEEIAKQANGFSGAQLNELVILAKKEALRYGDKDEKGIAHLRMAHFEAAITKMKKKKEFFIGFKQE